MGKSEDIGNTFSEYGVPQVTRVSENPETGGYLVYLQVQFDRRGRQIPSNYAIATAEAQARQAYGPIDVVLSIGAIEDVLLSVKSMLLRRHVEILRNVFCRIDSSGVTVWIEPKTAITDEDISLLREQIKIALTSSDLKLKEIISLSDILLPSDTVIVSLIRRIAPLSMKDIAEAIAKSGFEAPEDDWLMRRLDRLRKRRVIARLKDGSYVLTRNGLLLMGSGKDRYSPDVQRVLDLARGSE